MKITEYIEFKKPQQINNWQNPLDGMWYVQSKEMIRIDAGIFAYNTYLYLTSDIKALEEDAANGKWAFTSQAAAQAALDTYNANFVVTDFNLISISVITKQIKSEPLFDD